MKILYTARANIRGGRDGSASTDDGKLDVRLSFPTALGGDGAGTNPEQLFAIGYGACFAGTMATIAKAKSLHLENVEVDAAVDILLDGANYGLGVHLQVRASGLVQGVLESLARDAESACPYARATRNNIRTTIEVMAR